MVVASTMVVSSTTCTLAASYCASVVEKGTWCLNPDDSIHPLLSLIPNFDANCGKYNFILTDF